MIHSPLSESFSGPPSPQAPSSPPLFPSLPPLPFHPSAESPPLPGQTAVGSAFPSPAPSASRSLARLILGGSPPLAAGHKKAASCQGVSHASPSILAASHARTQTHARARSITHVQTQEIRAHLCQPKVFITMIIALCLRVESGFTLAARRGILNTRKFVLSEPMDSESKSALPPDGTILP
jgi:hypothetical protein